MKRAQLESHVLVLVTLALTAFGLVMVYSATSARAVDGGTGHPMEYLTRQGLFAGIGLVALILASRTPYPFWKRIAPSAVLVSLVTLAGVLVVGQRVNGARRWVSLGPFAFQPSEVAKIALAAWVAAYLARRRKRPDSLKELAKPLGLVTGLACVLILVEPDLGTAVAVVVMLAGIFVVAGLPAGLLVRVFSLVLAAGALAIWLEPYRRARFFAFLDPWRDQQGAGFQIVQAMIGLGSGGWHGVGLGHGAFLNLPEAHTDMIFATVGEELGLLGSLIVVCAYAAFAWAGFRIALACRDPFGKLLAAGITVLICGQAAINLAAVLAIAPLTGITLPFVSYGGSSLIAALGAVGILLNIGSADAVGKRAGVRDRGRGDRRPRPAVAGGRRSADRPRSTRDLRRVAGSSRSATGS